MLLHTLERVGWVVDVSTKQVRVHDFNLLRGLSDKCRVYVVDR